MRQLDAVVEEADRPADERVEEHGQGRHRVGAVCFFFNDTATTEIYTLSLHDALPISYARSIRGPGQANFPHHPARAARRSEEHTSELQSRRDLVCRLLLEKKKKH